ncbi:MAG: DUF421 domain-containing protein [Desulfobacteraceae bacterium]|nr:MAG: DUF421 domain-containing protein [Desulfobacteraceae bacterium]
MCIRAVVIFFYLLFLIRVGSKRIFGKNTSFDIVIGVMLGSILGRALTANSQFFPTIAASALLMLLHMLLAKLSFHSRRFGHMVKGGEVRLVESGTILWNALKRTSITEHDLMEGVRANGGVMEVDKVKAAFLERNGDISVIKKQEE